MQDALAGQKKVRSKPSFQRLISLTWAKLLRTPWACSYPSHFKWIKLFIYAAFWPFIPFPCIFSQTNTTSRTNVRYSQIEPAGFPTQTVSTQQLPAPHQNLGFGHVQSNHYKAILASKGGWVPFQEDTKPKRRIFLFHLLHTTALSGLLQISTTKIASKLP